VTTPVLVTRRGRDGIFIGAGVLIVAVVLAVIGVAVGLPILVGVASPMALAGLATLLANTIVTNLDTPKELRLGWPAVLHPIGVLLHLAMLGALWPVHVILDAEAFGEGSGEGEAFWMTLLFGAGVVALGLCTLPLHSRAIRLANGTHGRARVLIGTTASTVLIVSELCIAALAWLSQREHDAFALDSLFGESGPFLWLDTLATISASQGLGALLTIAEYTFIAALATQIVVLLASWFLIPERIRRVFFVVFDALVLCAFVFALWTLPFSPPEEGDATPALIALIITAFAAIRGLARLLPLLLDGIELSGFRALVASRLLRARKSGFLTVIGMLSILAVSFSSCTLTTTLSVMGGFRDDLQQKILGNSAHVVVDREYGSWDGWDPVLTRIRAVEGVEGASPYVEGEVMISSASNLGGAVLRGIDPETIVTDLPNNLRHGRLEYLSHPELLLDLSPEEMSGSLLERIEIAPRAAEATDAGARDAGVRSRPDAGPPAPADRLGLAREIDDLLASIDREIGEGPVTVPLPEPAPELPDGDRERSARLDELGEFLLPEAPEDRRARERALDLLPGLIVGAELARSLRLHVGDEVNLVSPNGELGPTGPMPRSRPFRVAGIFYSGMFEYDMQVAYTDLATAQRFLGLGSAITGIQVRVDDWERAEERSVAIAEVINRSEVRVRSWQEVNRNLFGALQLEKLAMFIMLLLAILVASFCVVGALMLMVQEKGREVGILKAMGAQDQQIVGVFLVQGLLIGLLGAISGCGLGYLVCFAAEHFGIAMDPEVYYIDRLPVHVEVADFVMVGVASVVVCLLATVYPAVLGSRLRPVDSLRQG
jgi:lipoprotein-releasing system permease protein